MQKKLPASRESAQQLFERAVAVWSKPAMIKDSPSWEGRPQSRALCETLSQRISETESLLTTGLKHQNQHVVAYCLLALDLASSPRLLNLADELLHDKRHITIIRGSFANSCQIGDLARQLNKKRRGAEPGASPNGGPVELSGSSGVGGGPPSVS